MKKWLGIGLSLILLAGVFFFIGPRMERTAAVRMLATTAPWAVVAAIVLFWLNFAVSTERYRLILRNMPVRAPGFGPLYRLTFLSLFLAHFVAVGPAADVVRVGYGRFRLELPAVTAIESVIYDRVLALAGLAILGLMLLPVQIIRGIPDALWLPQLVLWLASLGGIFLMTWGARTPVIQRLSFLAGIARSIKGFVPAASGRGSLIPQMLLAAGYSGTYGLTIWVLARGMGMNLGVLDMLQFSALILLVQSLPIFYMGWGARETVIIGTLGLSGALSSEQALAVSVATGAVFFLASLPGAVFWRLSPPQVPGTTDAV